MASTPLEAALSLLPGIFGSGPLAALNLRLANRVMSMSGSACRRSQTAKPIPAARAVPKPVPPLISPLTW